jgi:hypothetical protein
MLGEEPVRY